MGQGLGYGWFLEGGLKEKSSIRGRIELLVRVVLKVLALFPAAIGEGAQGKSRAEAEKAMERIEVYVEATLRLLVNRDKSKVARLKDCQFLGFKVNGKKIRRADQALKPLSGSLSSVLSWPQK